MKSNTVEDLIRRKEYIKYIANDKAEHNISDLTNKLYFKTYQKLAQNFSSLHSPLMRLVLKYDPGAGKTKAAILSGTNYIEAKRALGVSSNIIVIGFTKSIFTSELLNSPELGFFTEEEINEKNEKDKLVRANLITKQEYKQHVAAMKRRLTSLNRGGYFKFIGYKELANDLTGSSDFSSIEQLREMISSGQITINQDLLSQFADSFIIVDEFHKLYSSRKMNTFGIALKYVLDSYEQPNMSKLKVMFLSATPMTSSPREVIDLMNLVIPSASYTADEFFEKDELRKGSLAKIKEALRGYICYVRNEDPSLYPTRSFTGEEIIGVPYLKFERCIASKPHQALLKSKESIIIEDLPLLDYIIPFEGKYLYTHRDIEEAFHDTHFTGLDLNIVSKKYKKLVEISLGAQGKTLIFHPRIRSSGVIFISDLLREVGIIEYNEQPGENTICVRCRLPHKDDSHHKFIAARFIVLHGELPKSQMDDLLRMYNGQENTFGFVCQFCIGSEVILESLNFKACTDSIIAGVVDSAGALIQLFGRVVRMGSHLALPQQNRHVNMHILVTSLSSGISPEEQKYINIMSRYKVIQQIEKTLHEAAIDSALNYPIIRKGLADGMSLLYYEPDYDVPTKIDMSTFFKYYIDQDIEELIDIIKFVFINYSKVWTIDDLKDFLGIIDINVEFDLKNISYESFIIAINNMIYGIHVPLLGYSPIFSIDGIDHKLTHISDGNIKLLIASPCYLKNSTIGTNISPGIYNLTVDSWYRTPYTSMTNAIQIDDYLHKENISPAEIRSKFFRDSIGISESDILQSLYQYDEGFHIDMMRFSIRYVFNVLTNHDTTLIEYHYIVLRLLHIYTSLGYVIYAIDVSDEAYADFIDDSKLPRGYDQLLITRSNNIIEGKVNLFERLDEIISGTRRVPATGVEEIIKKQNIITKVSSRMLPVGYSICTSRKYEYCLYIPDEWITKYEPLFTNVSQENDIIIGYEVDVSGSLGKQFKLRRPYAPVNDKRLLNKGMVCHTYKKKEIVKIGKQLKIKVNIGKIKIACDDIKRELMRREIEARKNKTGIKWFYFSFEYNPLKH